MVRRKITVQELKAYIQNKSCNRPSNVFFAEDILLDPDHELAKKHKDEFRLRDIFDYIDIDDRTEDTTEAGS